MPKKRDKKQSDRATLTGFAAIAIILAGFLFLPTDTMILLCLVILCVLIFLKIYHDKSHRQSD